MSEVKILREASDVTPEIEQSVRDCVDWFDGEPSMPTEEFIDRLCHSYGGNDFDIESFENAAVRKIMRIARQERRERS